MKLENRKLLSLVNAVSSSPFSYLAAGLLYLFLVIMGLLPATPDGPDLIHFDKVIHWGAYGVFGALLFVNRNSPDWYLGPACILATLQEATHLGIVARHFEWLDVLANMAGIVCAWFIVRRVRLFLGINA